MALLLHDSYLRISMTKKAQIKRFKCGLNGLLRAGLSLALLLPQILSAGLGLSALVLSLSPASLHAAPGLLNFQGRLTDSGNNPRTGSFTMQFRITFGSDGSGELWSETQNNVPVSNGIFSVNVGASTPIPDTVFNTDTAYLEVTVAGEVLLPRQRLLSSSFAFNSAGVGGWTKAFFVSTAPVAQTLEGVKTFVSFPLKSGGLTPSLAGEFATKQYVDVFGGPALLGSTNTWTAQQTFTNALTVSNTNFLVVGGNVGIGTTSPGAALHIFSANPQLYLDNNSSGSKWTVSSLSNGETPAGGLIIKNITSGATAIAIQAGTGLVGIGYTDIYSAS